MARRPNLTGVGADLALAVAALGAGLLGLPLTFASVGLLIAAGIWLLTRWRALERMQPMQRLTNAALALGVLFVVLSAVYWIGLLAGGHT